MSRYVLRVANELIPVNKEIYDVYYKMNRRERYLVESDHAHGTVYYDALDTHELLGSEIFSQPGDSTEEQVINKITIEKLLKVLQYLNPEDMRLIHELYYNGKSERDYAKELGVYQYAIHKRKHRILTKLKKFFEE